MLASGANRNGAVLILIGGAIGSDFNRLGSAAIHPENGPASA